MCLTETGLQQEVPPRTSPSALRLLGPAGIGSGERKGSDDVLILVPLQLMVGPAAQTLDFSLWDSGCIIGSGNFHVNAEAVYVPHLQTRLLRVTSSVMPEQNLPVRSRSSRVISPTSPCQKPSPTL